MQETILKIGRQYPSHPLWAGGPLQGLQFPVLSVQYSTASLQINSFIYSFGPLLIPWRGVNHTSPQNHGSHQGEGNSRKEKRPGLTSHPRFSGDGACKRACQELPSCGFKAGEHNITHITKVEPGHFSSVCSKVLSFSPQPGEIREVLPNPALRRLTQL